MKKYIHTIKRVYITAAFLVLVVLAAMGISRAAYLNQSYKRGGARNREEEAVRFTSNYLELVAKDTASTSFPQRIVTYGQGNNDQISCEIDVRNYIPGSASLVNEYTITYELSVTFNHATPNQQYSVGNQSVTADSAGTCRITLADQRLQGRNSNKNIYHIYFYREDLNKLSITVQAKPVNMAYTGNQFLAGHIYPCIKSETQPFSCVGRFKDRTSDNSPADFDACNYEIILANGCARVTLTWETSYYEIDPFFESKLEPGDIIENTDGKMIFIMDQSKGNTSYVIPFYKKDKEACNGLDWGQMEEIISVTGEEIAPQTTEQ